jgi:hypothetical protein
LVLLEQGARGSLHEWYGAVYWSTRDRSSGAQGAPEAAEREEAMRRVRFSRLLVRATVAVVLTAAAAGGGLFASATSARTHATTIGPRHLVQIKVLSTRADLVSGDEALVQILLPPGAKASSTRLNVNGRDLTGEFAMRSNGKFEGLVTWLANGPNVLTAQLPDGYGARLRIVNHPIGGPTFSGPQIQPWLCQSGATDKQCDQAPTYAYYYVPAGQSGGGSNTAGSSSGDFLPYDPNNPPPSSAIATTTTTDGVTVPFIIRQEMGYIDRDSTPSRRFGSRASRGSRGRPSSSTTGGW